ncbi:DUF3482 domain-containing protein, partial [Myxococcota bacterium]|nr:DUF3482 domain-containing protein [Myxococcota bacterium]
LRWTGQPRMALINAIGDQDHRPRWRVELDQYFSIVRDFDAHEVSFIERVRLLRGMRELREDWRPPLDEALSHLVEEWRRRRKATARALTSMLIEALTLTLEESVPEGGVSATLGERLSGLFHARLRAREQGAREEIEALYAHEGLTREESSLAPLIWETDLFAESSWALLGLNTKQLILAGAAAGAITGGTIDAFVGGASFMTGTIIGGVGGAISGFRYANQRLASPQSVWRSLRGERLMRIGPHKSPNFPWVLLDRAVLHWLAVRDWAHARQGALTLPDAADRPSVVAGLSDDEQRRFSKLFHQLTHNPKRVSDKQREALEALIRAVLDRLSASEERALSAG